MQHVRTENRREVPLDEIAGLPVYPVLAIFPTLPDISGFRTDESLTLAGLADSIAASGLQEPLVLITLRNEEGEPERMLLGGRSRRAACILLDVQSVWVEDYIGTEAEADEYVLAGKLDRLSAFSATQKGLLAAKFEVACPEAFGRMKRRATTPFGLTDSDVNDMLGWRFHVSPGYVASGRQFLRQLGALEKEIGALEAGDQEDRDRAAEKRQKWSERQRFIALCLADPRKTIKETKKVKAKSADPTKLLRNRITAAQGRFKATITELAALSGQGEDDWYFCGRKITELIEHFERAFGMDVDQE